MTASMAQESAYYFFSAIKLRLITQRFVRFARFVQFWSGHDSAADLKPENPCITSLGLAVIDTIKFGNGSVVSDVLGGSGTFCTIGARLFVGSIPESVAWKVLAGDDFPPDIESQLHDWDTTLSIEKKPGFKSTRGLLEYEDSTFGPKKFRYTTPVLQVEPKDLRETPMSASSAFHLLCHPDKVGHIVDELLSVRGIKNRQALIVWEPAPPACTAANLAACLQAVQNVDVFSPNHLELLRLCDKEQETYSRALVEQCAALFLNAGIRSGRNSIAVIRAGEHGCMIMTNTESPAVWIPPYYTEDNRDKLVDTTGAGNGFLGGYIVGFLETNDSVEASCYGSVAASFMLEQIGVPKLSRGAGGIELWNEDNPRRRLLEFQSRIRHSVKW